MRDSHVKESEFKLDRLTFKPAVRHHIDWWY
jgi:hypothetical protein